MLPCKKSDFLSVPIIGSIFDLCRRKREANFAQECTWLPFINIPLLIFVGTSKGGVPSDLTLLRARLAENGDV
jgi:hypothetical protein